MNAHYWIKVFSRFYLVHEVELLSLKSIINFKCYHENL